MKKKITIKDINESDLINWGQPMQRFIEILKGEEDLDKAREGLLKITNSRMFGRGSKKFKENRCKL